MGPVSAPWHTCPSPHTPAMRDYRVDEDVFNLTAPTTTVTELSNLGWLLVLFFRCFNVAPPAPWYMNKVTSRVRRCRPCLHAQRNAHWFVSQRRQFIWTLKASAQQKNRQTQKGLNGVGSNVCVSASRGSWWVGASRPNVWVCSWIYSGCVVGKQNKAKLGSWSVVGLFGLKMLPCGGEL